MSAARRNQPENRAHPRFHVQIEVTLVSDSQLYTGLSENLSQHGVFVATHAARPIGEHVALTLTLPNSKPVQTVAEVCWVRGVSDRIDAPPGMGLRFTSLLDEDAKNVRAFLKRREPLFFD